MLEMLGHHQMVPAMGVRSKLKADGTPSLEADWWSCLETGMTIRTGATMRRVPYGKMVRWARRFAWSAERR